MTAKKDGRCVEFASHSLVVPDEVGIHLHEGFEALEQKDWEVGMIHGEDQVSHAYGPCLNL